MLRDGFLQLCFDRFMVEFSLIVDEGASQAEFIAQLSTKCVRNDSYLEVPLNRNSQTNILAANTFS